MSQLITAQAAEQNAIREWLHGDDQAAYQAIYDSWGLVSEMERHGLTPVQLMDRIRMRNPLVRG